MAPSSAAAAAGELPRARSVEGVGGATAAVGTTSGGGGGKMLCRAPQSGHFLRLHTAPTPHLLDPRTGEAWRLPVGGSVKAYHGRSCPQCGFELLLYVPNGRGPTRSYPLCPGCFHAAGTAEGAGEAAAAEGAGDSAGDSAGDLAALGAAVAERCSHCPHPESHPIVAELACCACPETVLQGGRLLIDPSGGPHWRLVSSRGRPGASKTIGTAPTR